MVKALSDGAQGFAFLTDQDRYDECEMALSQVASDIKKLAHKLNVCDVFVFFVSVLLLTVLLGRVGEEQILYSPWNGH